jgi:biogenesis of lysosome-related organelles complex 1 subunit KXD1
MPLASAYRPATSAPLTVPRKNNQQAPPLHPRQAPINRISTSPSSAGSSIASSAVPSLTNGGRSESSSREFDAASDGVKGIDLIDMMTDRLHLAVNPEPMDRSIAKQAQT